MSTLNFVLFSALNESRLTLLCILCQSITNFPCQITRAAAIPFLSRICCCEFFFFFCCIFLKAFFFFFFPFLLTSQILFHKVITSPYATRHPSFLLPFYASVFALFISNVQVIKRTKNHPQALPNTQVQAYGDTSRSLPCENHTRPKPLDGRMSFTAPRRECGPPPGSGLPGSPLRRAQGWPGRQRQPASPRTQSHPRAPGDATWPASPWCSLPQ